MITITDIKAVQHGETITVTAMLNDIPATIEFNEANIAELSMKERKAFIRERLIATRSDLHDSYDLGFDKV